MLSSVLHHLPRLCPAPYLLLGQQLLAGEELQALAGQVAAQLLQAVHPQCLGQVKEDLLHRRWGPGKWGCSYLLSGESGAPELRLRPTGTSAACALPSTCPNCLSVVPAALHTPALCLSSAVSRPERVWRACLPITYLDGPQNSIASQVGPPGCHLQEDFLPSSPALRNLSTQGSRQAGHSLRSKGGRTHRTANNDHPGTGGGVAPFSKPRYCWPFPTKRGDS